MVMYASVAGSSATEIAPVVTDIKKESEGLIMTTQDDSKELQYESASLVMDFIRISIMYALAYWVIVKKMILQSFPSLWITRRIRGIETSILKTNTWWVDGVSRICRGIRDGSATWSSLDIILRFNLEKKRIKFIDYLDYFWLKIQNARAVRDRGKLVEHELLKAMEDVYRRKGRVVLASIAYGSFEAVISACHKFIELHGADDINIFFFDGKKDVINHMKKRVEEENLSSICDIQRKVFLGDKWKCVVEYIYEQAGAFPHIVEVAGLFDHLSNDQIIALSSCVKTYLSEHGYFFTAHVHDNPERFFMETVLEWIMFYRSVEELKSLLYQSGFDEDFINIQTEPQGIHSVAICQN